MNDTLFFVRYYANLFYVNKIAVTTSKIDKMVLITYYINILQNKRIKNMDLVSGKHFPTTDLCRIAPFDIYTGEKDPKSFNCILEPTKDIAPFFQVPEEEIIKRGDDIGLLKYIFMEFALTTTEDMRENMKELNIFTNIGKSWEVHNINYGDENYNLIKKQLLERINDERLQDNIIVKFINKKLPLYLNIPLVEKILQSENKSKNKIYKKCKELLSKKIL